jgi:hypothetical protein
LENPENQEFREREKIQRKKTKTKIGKNFTWARPKIFKQLYIN